MPDFQGVIEAWDADGRTGGKHIHPLPPESPEFWALGERQAAQVAEYAEPGALLMDFGCGIGRLSIPLAKMGYSVLAVDSSQWMLDGLARRAAAAGVTMSTVRSDGSDLARIANGITDVVVARAVLIHHDYEGVERIVSALARTLRAGGYLIADWPIGEPGERRDWVDVTRWHPHHRLAVARLAGLEPVDAAAEPSVWRKTR